MHLVAVSSLIKALIDRLERPLNHTLSSVAFEFRQEAWKLALASLLFGLSLRLLLRLLPFFDFSQLVRRGQVFSGILDTGGSLIQSLRTDCLSLVLLMSDDLDVVQLLQRARNVDLLEHLVVLDLLARVAFLRFLQQSIELCRLLICCRVALGNIDRLISHELEELFRRQHVDLLTAKELVDDATVAAKEVQRHRMVVLAALADVDAPQLFVFVKQIVLGQITVHELADLVQMPNHHDRILI